MICIDLLQFPDVLTILSTTKNGKFGGIVSPGLGSQYVDSWHFAEADDEAGSRSPREAWISNDDEQRWSMMFFNYLELSSIMSPIIGDHDPSSSEKSIDSDSR